MNFNEFVKKLDDAGKLVKISREVDVKYEIPVIMKKMDGTPLLFTNVKGYDIPVVANICSTRELVGMGLGVELDEILGTLINSLENPSEPPKKDATGYTSIGPNLDKLPILTYYEEDGGPYIASSIVSSHHEKYGHNLSYHRMMKLDNERIVVRILDRDFNAYINEGTKEFAVCIGNSIPVMLAGAISKGRDFSEFRIANALSETPVMDVQGHLVPESDIIMLCEFTDDKHSEGPFLDLTETPDIVREQRVFRVKDILVRDGGMFHALLPGGLEHKTLMGMPREPTIFQEVSKVVDCKDVYITPGGTSWLHAVVQINKREPGDGKKAIFAAFQGHKSMKHVFIVDGDIDPQDPHQVEWAMATRFQGIHDIYMAYDKGSSLDPSSDTGTKLTTKMGFDLTVPIELGKEIHHFQKPKLPMELNVEDYLDGNC